MSRRVAVNGRFLTMTATGVQRYGHEILPRLARHLQSQLLVIVPPGSVFEDGDPEIGKVMVTRRWHGMRGHAWEQIALPLLVRRTGACVLWSPCQWGPLALPHQMPVIHDIAPLTHPEYYTPAYRAVARAITGPLVRRSSLVATPSRSVRTDLIARFGLEPTRVATIPPGVGAPFSTRPVDDLGRRSGRYCVFVGAHDSRKNPDFLLRLWPQVRERTGLELHLTRRGVVTARKLPTLESSAQDGITVHVDPSDDELANLYADALCLLWPSHYEGYGFPLLEAMAVGTPFLSTDVGAASELAIDRDAQILPLEPIAWIERLAQWQSEGVETLRSACIERARSLTWEAAAEQTAGLLERIAGDR